MFGGDVVLEVLEASSSSEEFPSTELACLANGFAPDVLLGADGLARGGHEL